MTVPDGAAPVLRLEGVAKRFGDAAAVDGVDLEIGPGELFALLGPSGCGKTTLLRLVAGFEAPDAGRILLDGVDMAGVPPHARPVNTVFQSYALFPHMTVEGNVAFGLRQERTPRAEIGERVGAALDLVEMRPFAGRKPHQLSGGQRQRVALARAIVKRPRLLLLDEPLSALDRGLRERTREELVEVQRRTGIAFVLVTHDQDEAMATAARIAVMDRGRVAQIGAPREIYERPSSRFVAGFVGAANLFDGRVAASDAQGCLVACAEAGFDLRVETETPPPPGATVWLAIRPEKIAVAPAAPADGRTAVRATVRDIVYRGDASTLVAETAGGAAIKASVPNVSPGGDDAPRPGETVWLGWRPDAVVLLRA